MLNKLVSAEWSSEVALVVVVVEGALGAREASVARGYSCERVGGASVRERGGWGTERGATHRLGEDDGEVEPRHVDVEVEIVGFLRFGLASERAVGGLGDEGQLGARLRRRKSARARDETRGNSRHESFRSA